MARLITGLRFLLLALPVTLAAQDAPSPPQTPRQAVVEMKQALLGLIAAQEAYWFRQHETYTTEIVVLRSLMPKPPAPGIVLAVHFAGGRAWGASAEHRALPGRSCVVFVGSEEDFTPPSTRRDKKRSGGALIGAPICDEP